MALRKTIKRKVEIVRERAEQTFANADAKKVDAAVCELLAETLAAGKTICFFSLTSFFETLHLSHLRKARFFESFADVLTGKHTHRHYGEWNVCEYECDTMILFQSAAVGEPLSINAESSHHATRGTRAQLRSADNVEHEPLDVSDGAKFPAREPNGDVHCTAHVDTDPASKLS